MKKNLLGWGVLIVLLTIVVFAGLTHKVGKAENTVRVGMLSVMTGIYAEVGIDAVNGAAIAVDEINSIEDFKIDLIVENGQAIAQPSIKAFQRLLYSGIDASISVGDIQVPPVAPLIEKNKIPTVITVCGNAGWLPYNKDSYMLYNWPATSNTSFVTGQYAKNNLKLNKVAILSMISIYGNESADGFVKGFDGKIVSHEKFNPEETDLRVTAQKIIYTRPEAVFVTGHGKGYIIALNQLREQGYKGLILSDTSTNEPQTVENVRNLNGIIFTKNRTPDLKNDSRYLTFKKEYVERFKKEPSLYSNLGYDSVRILAEAIRRGGMTSEGIHEGLKSITEFDTFSGKIEFNPDGTSMFPVAVMQMQADKTAKVIKEF